MKLKTKKNKIISSIILFCFLSINILPALTYAQGTFTSPFQNQNGGFKSITEGASLKELGDKSQEAAKGVAQLALVCSISVIAGNMIKTGLSSAMNAASGWLSKILEQKVGDIIETKISTPKVPVIDSDVRQNTAEVTKKEVSITGARQGVISGIMDFFDSPSLDAIGFCLVNEMIHYILRATIEWVNSGFEGQPVFIDNPGAFFQEIADREAGILLQDIISGGTGINICEPFRVQLVLEGISTHTGNYQRYSQCSLSQIKDNYDRFLDDWNEGGLPGWFEIIQDNNNYWGSKYMYQRELQRRIQTRQNTATIELNWAKGFRSFKYCDAPEDKRRSDGSCDPQYEKTGTPGDIVENAVNQRIGSPQRRLEFSDEFDELVASLVNQLIRIAVNELFGQGSDGKKSQTPFY